MDIGKAIANLIWTTQVAFELVVRAQGLGGRKSSEAMCDTRVLIHVNLQVEEILFLVADLDINEQKK